MNRKMTNELQPRYSDIIFYTSPEGNVSIEVIFNDETFWLSQKKMAELFGVDVRTVNEHRKSSRLFLILQMIFVFVQEPESLKIQA